MNTTKKLEEKLLNNRDVKRIMTEKRLAYEIADMVVDARAKAGITQKQLAERIGTQQPSIARIEAGEKLPSISFLEKIAEALDTTLIAPKFEFLQNFEYSFTENPVKKEKTVTAFASWMNYNWFSLSNEAFDKTKCSNYANNGILSRIGGI